MISRKSIEDATLRELFRFMIENRISRRALLAVLDRRLRRELIEINVDDRPRRVQELKHAYLMAILHGFERALSRGYVSSHVTGRLIDTVIENIVFNPRKKDETHRHGPLLLVVSPTGRCNLRCRGCYAASEAAGGASLPFAVFDRIVTEMRELWDSHFVVVSGGEPYLWSDEGRGLLELAERHPSTFFMTYTNGTRIAGDTARRMAELGNISPAVSLEGFEGSTDARRGRGAFAATLDLFERLRRHGVPFGVSVTPTRENWDEVTGDPFMEFCFDGQGAIYCWSFQYMPIGSSPDPGLMIEPEARLEMLRRTHRLINERRILVVDFWNGGTASYGCVSAGRSDGHFHIDWNGDATPCVFVPFAAANIHDVYATGGDLNTVLDTPFFRRLRRWQDEYGFRRPAAEAGNWLRPCPMRDHFEVVRSAALETGARPVNEAAARALTDRAYGECMIDFAERYGRLCADVWADSFADAPAPEHPANC